MRAYNGTWFAYDGSGRRISKNGITYTYDGNGNLISDSNGIEYLYDNSGIFAVKYQNSTYFYRKDVQGNVISLLDENGSIVVKYIYDAWGNHAVLDGAGNDITDDDLHIGNLNPFRYRGYFYDPETELYYLQTRYYDPEVGRFITIDAIEYLDPESINGLNLYAYCGNNPVMNVDPIGTSIIALLAILGIGAVVGGIIGGKVAYDNGARGWDLVGGIFLGVAAGIATAGAFVCVGTAVVGAIGMTTFLGVATQTAFAVGALAVDLFGVLVAPILGISMQLIEFGVSEPENLPNKTPWYDQPTGFANSRLKLNDLLKTKNINNLRAIIFSLKFLI